MNSTGQFWVLAWLATTVAGGLFGTLFGCILGLIMGAIIAGIYGIPVHITAATLTWALWLNRFRCVTAAIAGGVTGVLATWLVFEPSIFGSDQWRAVALAALCGSLCTGAVVCWYTFVANRDTQAFDPPDDARWQFTLKDMFIRFTVVACLLAGWIWLIVLVNPPSPAAWEPWRELALPSDAVIENHAVNQASMDAAVAFSIRYESEAAIDVVIDAYNLQPCTPNSREVMSYIALQPPPWWSVSQITETYARADRESESYASLWVDRDAKRLYVEVGHW